MMESRVGIQVYDGDAIDPDALQRRITTMKEQLRLTRIQLEKLKKKQKQAQRNMYRQKQREEEGKPTRVSSSFWQQSAREYNPQILELENDLIVLGSDIERAELRDV